MIGAVSGRRCLALAAAMAAMTGPAPAQDSADLAWSARKCALHDRAWQAALRMQGPAGIGAEFSDRNAAFVAAGCLGERNVCPRSAAELALADLLTVMVVSEGIAGTCLPFGCPPEGEATKRDLSP